MKTNNQDKLNILVFKMDTQIAKIGCLSEHLRNINDALFETTYDVDPTRQERDTKLLVELLSYVAKDLEKFYNETEKVHTSILDFVRQN